MLAKNVTEMIATIISSASASVPVRMIQISSAATTTRMPAIVYFTLLL